MSNGATHGPSYRMMVVTLCDLFSKKVGPPLWGKYEYDVDRRVDVILYPP